MEYSLQKLHEKPGERSRVLLLVCVLIYTVLLVVFYSTADVGEGRAAVLVQLRDANAHVQEPTQVRGKSVVAREAGGGALRAEAASSIHVSVKTTAKLHKTRLVVIMLTWMRTVPDPAQVHIITNGEHNRWKRIVTGAGFILQDANCSVGHSLLGLWCMSAAEYIAFFEEKEAGKKKSWFCHFDDDVYVNFPRLVDVLMSYSPTGSERLYLGLQPPRRRNQTQRLAKRRLLNFPEYKQDLYQYAAGAAYCISTALMGDMEKYIRSSERFEATCASLSRPDDVCVGAIIVALLGTNLTEVEHMMSHEQNMGTIPAREHRQLVTCSYKLLGGTQGNVLRIPHSTFSVQEDPTRFLSYHCLIHPETEWCRHPPRVKKGRRVTSILYHRVAAASNLRL